MVGPINYMEGYQPVNIGQQVLGGLQAGAAIGSIENTAEKQRLALEQQKLYQTGVQEALANPTPQAFASLALRFPAQREAIKQGWDQMSEADKQAEGTTMSHAYAALNADQPEVAKQVIQQQIDARKNSGLPTTDYDNALALINNDPKKAIGSLGLILSHVSDPKTFAATYSTLGKAGRDEDQAPAELRTVNAKASQAEADAAQKEDAVVGSAAGALVGKGATIGQVATMFKSQAAKGLISKENAAAYIDAIPTDPKVRDQWLGSFQMQGVKPEDQLKLTTPDANAKLSAETSRYSTNVAAGTAAARLKFDKDQAASGDDTATFTPDAVDNAAARYNIDGTLPPMGMGAAAAAGRTKILNRAAELKKGIDPEQQRRDQLANKGKSAAVNKAVADFSTGKNGNAVRSFNVGLAHLDTLDQLATALDNKDTRLLNKIGNAVATQTGAAAPTSFNAAKKIVGDEIVKAVVGGGGGGVHDREEVAKTIDAASSPAQLKAVIKTYKELMVGQLGGLQQQYKVTTGRDDFDSFLSAEAIKVRGNHAPKTPTAAAAPALPSGWTVKEH